jgi:hypothetical protein
MMVIVKSVISTPGKNFREHPRELVPEMVIKVPDNSPEHEAQIRHTMKVVPENQDPWGHGLDVNEPPF